MDLAMSYKEGFCNDPFKTDGGGSQDGSARSPGFDRNAESGGIMIRESPVAILDLSENSMRSRPRQTLERLRIRLRKGNQGEEKEDLQRQLQGESLAGVLDRQKGPQGTGARVRTPSQPDQELEVSFDETSCNHPGRSEAPIRRGTRIRPSSPRTPGPEASFAVCHPSRRRDRFIVVRRPTGSFRF